MIKYSLFLLLISQAVSPRLDVFKLLDSISDSIDYFLFNYKAWSQDLRFTLRIVECQSKRILEGYVKSELDFEALYVPVLRRFHGQAKLLIKKIQPQFLLENLPKELPFDHLIFGSSWGTNLLYPHRISDNKLIWKEHKDDKYPTPSSIEYTVCLLKFLNPTKICEDEMISRDPTYKSCITLLSNPPWPHLNGKDFPFDIINTQLLFSIVATQVGCEDIFERELGILGKNIFNWQAELCTNAHSHWSQKSQRSYLSATLLKTEYSCLLLGFVDFVSKERLATFQLHSSPLATYESSGCILGPHSSDSDGLGVPLGGGESDAIGYSPYSHPFAYDFSFPLSQWYPSAPRGISVSSIVSSKRSDQSQSSAKSCDPLLTNYVTRIQIMYIRYILDPGPEKFKEHWLEPDMYMEKTLNANYYHEPVKKDGDDHSDTRSVNEAQPVPLAGVLREGLSDPSLDNVRYNVGDGHPKSDKDITNPESVVRPISQNIMPLDVAFGEGEGGAGYYVESLLDRAERPHESRGKEENSQFFPPLPEPNLVYGIPEEKGYFTSSTGYLLIYVVCVVAVTYVIFRQYRRRLWKYRGLHSISSFTKMFNFSKLSPTQKRTSAHNY